MTAFLYGFGMALVSFLFVAAVYGAFVDRRG